MHCKLAFATLAVIIGSGFVSAQKIPPETTAAELWNPWTWFWPYAIASAEAYRDYYEKAQKATNELYQQIYKTNAFPLITGNWNISQNNQGENGGQSNRTESGTQPGQGDSTLPNKGGNQENSTQKNQESNNEQADQEGTTPANPKVNDKEEEKTEESSNAGESSGVQTQGNVQDDGTADVGADAKVEQKS